MITSERIGFIVPSVNTVIEDELRELLPLDISYSIGRVTLGTGDTKTQLAAFETTVPDEAGKLGDARADAVVLACTSASIMRGSDYDAALTGSISERAGCPAVSATAASVSALRSLGARRVLVLTPYEAWLHELEQAYLRAAGFDVAAARLGTLPQHLGTVAPADLVREVIDLVATAGGRPDAVLVSCANARLFAAVPQLEDAVQVPVVTSNQAAAWAALHLVGHDTAGLPWGTLGRHNPPAARPTPQTLAAPAHGAPRP